MKAIAAFIIASVLAAPVSAQSSGFGFSATVAFDPNQVISVSGGTLGALFSEFTGPGAAQGQIVVEGDVTYDLSQPPTLSHSHIGAYQTALTSVELRIGQNGTRLNVPHVLANAGSSKIGTVIQGNVGFCADYEHCQMMGVPNAPYGMQVLVMNDIPNTLLDESGRTEFASNDVFAFMAGRTDAVGEFDQLFQTQGFGVVSLDGFALGLFSVPGTDFYSGTALPAITQFTGAQNIERTEFWFFVEGPQLVDKIKVEGVVSMITPHSP